uniref:methyltransferase-like protein 27 n=1 Tax=Ciona intestinalis TaxID=7719 RepID=UPI000180C4A1|nr:methyltransferase-like protein 27 [Ciona intestinalis]|eukprot:XP_002120567.1 methyltransferase-like protein 27 [Ciona intestinalis]
MSTVDEAYGRSISTYPIKSSTKVRKYYNSWANKYDDDLTAMSYRAPDAAVGKAATLLSEEQKKVFKVLDLGSGTGLVGVSLRKFGFQGEVTALDGAAEMLQLAKKKNIYNDCHQHILTLNHPLPYPDDNFDLIISVGGFGNNMMQPDCLQEVFRVLKPGCFFVLTIRLHSKSNEYRDRLNKELKQLEANGLMQVASREAFMQYNWKGVTSDQGLDFNDQFADVYAMLKNQL